MQLSRLRRVSALDVAVFLVLLAMTFQDSLAHFGPIDLSLTEIVIVATLVIWITTKPGLSLFLRDAVRDPLLLLMGFLIVCSQAIWLFSKDWGFDLNELRWQILAAGTFLLFLRYCQDGWRWFLLMFMATAVLAALVADVQALTNAFVPPFSASGIKVIYLSNTLSIQQRMAIGFFRHPNAFGAYAFWPFLISLAGVSDSRWRWWSILGLSLFGLSMYLSFYRGILFAAAFALLLWAMTKYPLSPRRSAFVMLFVTFGAVGASVMLFVTFGALAARFFGTLLYRADLWNAALQFFGQDARVALLGAGFSPTVALASSQARSDPHNAYLYMLMHFGVPGLLVFVLMGWIILKRGWQDFRRRSGGKQALVTALWIGSICWYLTDAFDSRITTSEWIILQVAMLALFWAVSGEIRNGPMRPDGRGDGGHEKGGQLVIGEPP